MSQTCIAIDFPSLEVQLGPDQWHRYKVWAEYVVVDRDHWVVDLDDFEATNELGLAVTDRAERAKIRRELVRWGEHNAGELCGRN